MNAPKPDGTARTPPSAAPSLGARLLAFAAVLIGGGSGGLVGYSVTDLQCGSDCPTLAGAMGVLGATLASLGVGIVVVLTLRAMTEWHAGRLQRAARDNHPVS